MTRPDFLDPIKEAKALSAIREAVGLDASDEALVLDTAEGETSLLEALDAMLGAIMNDEVMVEGLAVVISDLAKRKGRFEQRIRTSRAIVEQAMTIAELAKLERPTATLSVSARAPSLQVLEESEIPARYWKAGAPTLDKKALTADLRERAKALAAIPAEAEDRAERLSALPPEIPGVALSNGAPSLTIRRL